MAERPGRFATLAPAVSSAFLFRLSGAALCAVPLIAHAQAPAKPPAERRAALAATLSGAEKSAAAGTLMEKPGYRTALLAHEVLRLTGDKALTELSASDPKFNAFLDRFLADPEWLTAYLCSGRPIADTPDGLQVLFTLWKAEGASPDFAKYRELTAALANQWSAGPNAETLKVKEGMPEFSARPLDRFRLYRHLQQKGRLHPMFKDLKSWELGYVVGQQWSDKALYWLNQNVNLPLERYPDACWAVEYKGTSDFGDTVQGPLYLRPWNERMNEAQNTLSHGSVCGGLSTFGVCAAAAHGIPAYTVGQPGHCAMGIRFARGDWRGGFGGPDGGTHINIWKGNIHYIDVAEAVFGDDDRLHAAMLQLARSHVLADAGDAAGADAALTAAVASSPMHLDLRREQIARMKQRGATPAEWNTYAAALLKDFGVHAHPAVDLCAEFEDAMLAGADDSARAAWYGKIHQAAARATDSWAWEIDKELLEKQGKKLNTDAGREVLLKEALVAHLGGKGTSFGKVLEWGVKTYVEAGNGETFGRAFSAAVASASGATPDPKKLREGYTQAILASEAARSTPAFQALSASANTVAPEPPPPLKLDLPAGTIVSSRGHIRASSSAWDDPLSHLQVLGETGGRIHTKDEANPWLIVELPQNVTLGGVLMVKTDGNQERLKHVRVSRSTDGATWFPIAESPDMPRQWKVDAPAGTQARWLKFEALNDKPEFLHLRNFIVTANAG